jgi:hypothetical protein
MIRRYMISNSRGCHKPEDHNMIFHCQDKFTSYNSAYIDLRNPYDIAHHTLLLSKLSDVILSSSYIIHSIAIWLM